jgi:hypothetical protein
MFRTDIPTSAASCSMVIVPGLGAAAFGPAGVLSLTDAILLLRVPCLM